MSKQRVILCGESTPPGQAAKKTAVHLNLWGKNRNVTLKLTDISRKMVANIPPVLADLLEIATYVYCADQATTRGTNSARDYGASWRRRFQFHIPVRDQQLWSSAEVSTALRDTLGFLSDDEYDFSFRKLSRPPSFDQYLDFGSDGETASRVDEVLLFSGGLDSLGGTVKEVLESKRSVALVSHRSSPKIANRQQALLQDFETYASSHYASSHKPFHIPVWINKEKSLGREYTQRTRSFLYASLAAIVARLFRLSRIRFYENGVVSINLPISPQVIGGRATRTTHPQVLTGFSELFSAVFRKSFSVENPFQWMTKAEIVRTIRQHGCGKLIKHTVSCTRVWEMTTLKTHCGVCSQCIDRRFATLSAGCPDYEDPEEMYAVDLLRGERPAGEKRTMIESYAGMAKRVRNMSDTAFFTEFGEVHRATQHIKGMKVDDAATQILGLYKRHAGEVSDVIAKGIQTYAADISDGLVPSTCLLILALPDQYKQPSTCIDPLRRPLLILDEIVDGETNRGLLARLVGNGRFQGVNKKIGARELFFIYLLFVSQRSLTVADEHTTVVTEDDAVQTLLKWRENGYLRFNGKDTDKPTHRIQKMWGEFVRQLEKERNLLGLFTRHTDLDGHKLYGLRLHPNEKQVLVANISALFRRPQA